MMRILSLGAGVQSTTMALMVAHGELDPVDCAIFADTQSEPSAVYEHLSRLRAALPFPVYVVSSGSLRDEIGKAAEGLTGKWARLPLFIRNTDGSDGMLRRQCTQDYKLNPIYRKVRELAGVKPGSPGPRHATVTELIGISIDEATRQRESRVRWIEHEYPLVRHRITRAECLLKLEEWGWQNVPKSACTFCPYHSDAMWAEMKAHDTRSFEDAVMVDKLLRVRGMPKVRGTLYLHRQRQPLDTIAFRPRKIAAPSPYHQLDFGLFGQECSGGCGL